MFEHLQRVQDQVKKLAVEMRRTKRSQAIHGGENKAHEALLVIFCVPSASQSINCFIVYNAPTWHDSKIVFLLHFS